METQKNNMTDPETKRQVTLTEQQKLRRRKMIVLPAMVLVFLGAMWLIFAPSSKDEAKAGADGYNTEMPDADKGTDGIIGDKSKAYEQSELEERKAGREASMQQLGEMLGDEEADEGGNGDFSLTRPSSEKVPSSTASEPVRSSADACRNLSTTLGNFYERPAREDGQMDRLMERLSQLETQKENEKEKSATVDEQMALMEKSYQLAAKYMGTGKNGQAGQTAAPVPSEPQTGEKTPAQKTAGNKVTAVRQVSHHIVSALPQPMGNGESVSAYGSERNDVFHTAVGSASVTEKNTLSACVYGTQSVKDGQTVRLRLLEAMSVAEKTIPRNAVVVGTARIQGERLEVAVTSVEHAGMIIPLKLSVYDTDGQKGIFIPGSMEMDAVREVAANMGGSLGSSVNISTNAGAQLASDMGKGLIQGTSQYIAKKMRTVKVHLKTGYKVMLYQEKD